MLKRILRSKFVNNYTSQIEGAVVAAVLLCVLLTKEFSWIELIGSVAVLLTFLHAQVANCMTEQQATLETPTVECYRWAGRYYVAKEVFWFAYFALMGAWSALVGVFVFLLFPYWRKLYRRANA